MSTLGHMEKRKIEKILGMETGYVLNFSDKTFAEFFADLDIDITNPKYFKNGTSKAKRLRAFWEIEEDFLVSRVLRALISYGDGEGVFADSNPKLMEECIAISERLQNGNPDVSELSNGVNSNNITLELLISEMKSSLDRGNPEAAIDRLHTFTTNFIREICAKNSIHLDKDKPLHSLLGEYIKVLKKKGKLESSMAERILKSNISILEAFNDVRNNQSLAHDNKPLNKIESKFIFNSVVNAIKFLRENENIN
ncbi:abortive infection family protein [Acinetobacter indicus]|uniref:abortive infection family protein n=2 Tax=Acinetobacter indicus TaxID=756892 RepID=UPI000CECA44A|nr:abortive infection family protein [Acinetobacter indicus]